MDIDSTTTSNTGSVSNTIIPTVNETAENAHVFSTGVATGANETENTDLGNELPAGTLCCVVVLNNVSQSMVLLSDSIFIVCVFFLSSSLYFVCFTLICLC